MNMTARRAGRIALDAGRKAVNHRTTKRVAPIVGLLLVNCVFATAGAYAQTTGHGSVGDAAYRAFNEMYESWRGPISLAAIFIGFICMMVMGRNSYQRILIIAGAVVGLALAPEIYNTLNFWGNGH
jgi:type IV secretory pathway VirB2 component (pilin)